jgi:GNAT superfamily N-acetyltransferase
MSAPIVRQAALADLEPLAALFDQYRQFQRQGSDIAAARAFIRDRLGFGQSVVFIAVDGASALGFAQLYPSFSSVSLSRVFVLNDLFVHESGRRTGVASLLLSAVEAHAWALGASRVTLNVAKDNPTAQQLYEARGWRLDQQFNMYHRFPPT